jgi:hypothetical protein
MKAFLLLFFPFTLFSQTWTDPINISNITGLNDQPDLCIDNNGTLHCVFVHKLASNWRKIYYTKSADEGETWTTPEDISLNTDLTMYGPNIVSDTNNILYVSYDYNVGNPAMSLIYMRIFDGTQWNEPLLISEGMYNSDYNELVIDKNNRLYIFWLYLNQLMYYRTLYNGVWSDTICPYAGNHTWMLFSAKVDGNVNIHCVGGFSDPGPPLINQCTIYFWYSILNNQWSDKTFVSPPTDFGSIGGADIDLNSEELPAIAYRQKTYGTGQNNDSTMYTNFDGADWSEPELVTNDPYEQEIAIDSYNRVHIIDREKLETGTKLVHYQKINDLWLGYIIDEADNLTNFPDLTEKNKKLYLVYNKSDVPANANVYITKFNIITGVDATPWKVFDEFKIFPNPFITETIIEFRTSREEFINISICGLDGKQIVTIDERKFSTGIYKYKWNGTDQNGKEVKAGTYLIRLQADRHVITKPVEKVN